MKIINQFCCIRLVSRETIKVMHRSQFPFNLALCDGRRINVAIRIAERS